MASDQATGQTTPASANQNQPPTAAATASTNRNQPATTRGVTLGAPPAQGGIGSWVKKKLTPAPT